MNKECPILQTIEFLGKRWALPIVVELCRAGGWKRYSELKARLLDITPKMLSTRLKDLEKERLIRKRVDSSTFPIRSEYSLTERGKDLICIMKAFKDWGLKWKFNNRDCKSCREALKSQKNCQCRGCDLKCCEM